MCGIFGYVGPSKHAAQIVFGGLKRLEYRGYDSWGIVAREKRSFDFAQDRQVKREKLTIEKHIGKIPKEKLKSSILNLKSNLVLGHTRWATHGGVTKANAHPHLDCKGGIAVVHNGIVENYLELKSQLTNHRVKSETDTEIVVHLVEGYAKKLQFEEAVAKAFLKTSGINSFVFTNGEELVAVKSGSPLVVGLGEKEYYIASDPSAIISKTKKAIFVEDNQLISISEKGVSISDVKTLVKIKPKISQLDWEAVDSKLGKFEHFMIKEIYEQPKVLTKIAKNGKEIGKLAKLINKAHGVFFIGCGTASYAALSGSYLFSSIAKKHVNFAIGSEFDYLEHYVNRETLVVAISQSGETIDVVVPVERAKKKGATIVALTNVQGSTLYRMADLNLLLNAGPELAVCATKSFSAMVANLIYLAYATVGRANQGRKIISGTGKAVLKILKPKYIGEIKKLTKMLSTSEDIYIIGRGLSYPTALEASLKLKEVPYVHSEGFAGGELKHGVIALVEKGTPCIVFAPNDETYDDIISNAIEIKARGGYIIGVSHKPNEAFDFYLPVGDCAEGSIIANTVPIQLLAYYLALEKGLDPDKPRNLAKSVTVK